MGGRAHGTRQGGEGALLLGRYGKSGLRPASRNPGSGFITCSPSTSLLETGRAPWKTGTLPLPSLEGSSGSDPSCQRCPPLQPGPCTCLLPGAWEMLSQVGDTVGDLGAGSAHSGSWRPLPTLRDRVGSHCAAHVTTPLWASVSSPRKWGVREPG